VSRMELANTICELLGWSRASGGLKGRECREWLERLEAEGMLALPEKRKGRPVGSRTRVPETEHGEAGRALVTDRHGHHPLRLRLGKIYTQFYLAITSTRRQVAGKQIRFELRPDPARGPHDKTKC
jgi:hypothetical protein